MQRPCPRHRRKWWSKQRPCCEAFGHSGEVLPEVPLAATVTSRMAGGVVGGVTSAVEEGGEGVEAGAGVGAAEDRGKANRSRSPTTVRECTDPWFRRSLSVKG
jgi:hypothetical protein